LQKSFFLILFLLIFNFNKTVTLILDEFCINYLVFIEDIEVILFILNVKIIHLLIINIINYYDSTYNVFNPNFLQLLFIKKKINLPHRNLKELNLIKSV